MVERQEEAFSSRILHYTSSLRGTKQCLQRQLSRLLSMVDTLGFPTVFFAHSAADLQWPELAYLPRNPDSRNERAKAVIEKPAIAYWFFYHRVMEFIEVLYTGVLGATDHWLRFEWQHRGSSYVHGLAWLPDTPDVEKLGDSTNKTVEEEILSYADQLVSTINPRCSNIAATSNKDIDQDQADLVATCQQHTYFTFYCLHTKHGKQECHFGDPIVLQPHTAIVTRMSQLSSQLEMMGLSTTSTLSSCLSGMLMWTCSTLSPVRESCSTVASTLSLSRKSLPPLSTVSTLLSRQSGSCSSTLRERETTLPRELPPSATTSHVQGIS